MMMTIFLIHVVEKLIVSKPSISVVHRKSSACLANLSEKAFLYRAIISNQLFSAVAIRYLHSYCFQLSALRSWSFWAKLPYFLVDLFNLNWPHHCVLWNWPPTLLHLVAAMLVMCLPIGCDDPLKWMPSGIYYIVTDATNENLFKNELIWRRSETKNSFSETKNSLQ
jgi:hypothetical protein